MHLHHGITVPAGFFLAHISISISLQVPVLVLCAGAAMAEGMAQTARHSSPLFVPQPTRPIQVSCKRSRKTNDELCLELTLSTSSRLRKDPRLVPPTSALRAEQAGSSDGARNLCLELCLWPPSGLRSAPSQTTEEEMMGSSDTGHSRASGDTKVQEETLPGGDGEAQSRKSGVDRRDVGEAGEDAAWEDEAEEEEAEMSTSPATMEKKLSAINWTAPVPVLEKKLYATDVSAGHCRLLLAENNGDEGESKPEGRGPEVLLSLLTDAEKAAVAAKNGGLPVLLLDRWGREYPAAKLRLWCSSGSYVLLGKWMDFVRQNELDPGDVIDVYFFRPRFAEEGGAAARVGLVVCSRVHPEEEERRRRDGPEVRKWRCEEKGNQMRKHKRRKC